MDKTNINENENRILKLDKLKELGINPYPNTYRDIDKSSHVLSNFEELEKNATSVNIAGRLILKRIMGKSSFATIKDYDGKIQVYFQREELPEGIYNDVFKKLIDIGDIIGVNGTVFKTKSGEITVRASSLTLLSKSLNPLPEKFHGLTDTELRYRKRYVDLIVNDEVKETFITRSKIIKDIRSFLDDKDFLEVETPMMQSIPGGAKARPFITHHNTLDMDLYLRIAPELYLKRLIVGGFEKIFELNRNFRNEGISTRHNPEFTMLEVYQTYANYEDMMYLCEGIFKSVCENVIKSTKIKYGESSLDFSKPFRRLSMTDAIKEYTDVDFNDAKTDDEAVAMSSKLSVDFKGRKTRGEIIATAFEEIVEDKLIEPTFITDFPKVISPLSKSKADNSDIAERFELFIGGYEVANAFSELNDGLEQKEIFERQAKSRDGGDEEAMFMDSDYVEALKYGMPPAGGLGIGIDRLVMIMTDSSSIRDTILFPQLRK